MRKTLVLLAALAAPWANAAYKCVDDRGVTHIGDTPPAGCANVVMYEMTPGGKVLRKIDPTPTEEQLRARAQEYERAKAAIRNEADQKRKDMALINTFSTEHEFDVARDRNIEPLKSRILLAQDRIKAIDKRAKELEEELEFYKAGKSKSRTKEAPPQLTGDLIRLKTERTTLETSIVNSEKEIESLKTKFDADKRRWVALKGGTKPGEAVTEASAEPAKPAEATPAAAKPAPATKPAVKKN